jgi:hypothetical protein
MGDGKGAEKQMARFWVSLLALLLVGPTPVVAEGALAFGMLGDVSKDGIAVGGSINKATEEAAIAKALTVCRGYTGAKEAAANCKIVAIFSRQCFAVAFDPAAGTPGVGWAIDPDRNKANAQAMALCQDTAGQNRRQFCKIDQSYCDMKDTEPN